MKRILIPILALAVLVGLVKAVVAAADQIYVYNQLYTGRVHREAGTTWLSLDDFMKAARIAPSDLLHTPPTNGATTVTYNKRRFSVPVDAHATDTLYVDGQRLVEGMGGRWSFNSSLGLTDIYVPAVQRYQPHVATATGDTAPSPPPAANPEATKPAAAASPAATTATAGGSEKTPLRIDKFEYVDPTLPNNFANVLVHGTVVIKNTGEDYVDGVQAIVHIQDGYENDLAVVKKDIGRIEGGKDVSWDWSWSNSSGMLIHPMVEVVSNQYLTKAERDKLGKDAPPPKKVTIKSGPTAGVPAASATVTGGSANTLTPTQQAPANSYTPGAASPGATMAPPGFGPGAGTPAGTESPTTTPTSPPGF